ncbi:MAG: hypothetical protein Fur0041_10120 [Bacteroidia bacterium]
MKLRTLFFIPAVVTFIAITGAAIQQTDLCDSKALKENAKAKLDPFKYDSGKVTRIMYKNKNQMKEIEVPVFIGERYRFVFNMEGITRDVIVNIYNKDKESKNRKVIWSSKDAKATDKMYVFEPDAAKFKFYVDYDIPAVKDSLPAAECLVFMLGYK